MKDDLHQNCSGSFYIIIIIACSVVSLYNWYANEISRIDVEKLQELKVMTIFLPLGTMSIPQMTHSPYHLDLEEISMSLYGTCTHQESL